MYFNTHRYHRVVNVPMIQFMLKFVCSLLLLSFVISACHSVSEKVDKQADLINPEEVEIVENTDEFGDQEEYSRKKSDYSKHGQYTKYAAEGGHLIEKAFYVNDTLHGVRVLFGEKADTQIVENYQMGRFEGPFLAYYENGQLELQGEYSNNTMSGKWKRYYKTGELMEVVTFRDNKENGPFVEYYPNGKLKAEGQYLEGDHEHGLLKLYDEEGVLVKKMQCEKGICSTTWELGKEN